MRAYLIDATIQTVTKFDFIDKSHEPEEILGGLGRGDFSLGSGPLKPPQDSEDEDYLNDFLYIRQAFEQSLSAPPNTKNRPAFIGGKNPIKGDPRCWFQIDADLDSPATFPIPGRGLVIGVTGDGLWCDARLTLEQLTRRVSFTRRKLRGFTTWTEIMKGETWTGPVAPIIERG
jgi:hypothetical protein